tara:strand:- start:136 stop:441 length:306 start_codon:yes stop_codon:yes gene_type:complete
MTVQVIATGAVSFMVEPAQAQLPKRVKTNQRQTALNARARTPAANKPHVITDKTRDYKPLEWLINVDLYLSNSPQFIWSVVSYYLVLYLMVCLFYLVHFSV